MVTEEKTDAPLASAADLSPPDARQLGCPAGLSPALHPRPFARWRPAHMVDPVTGRVLTFNGEIYNFGDLRRLVDEGQTFQSTGDRPSCCVPSACTGRPQ